ncbi:Aureobasidin resistance protein Aur1 [Boothiomyces sp. JEL0838]|nr:Aureobasidin resistance protein Aur1 [Boothiomyces sp. JEL0838]
MTKIELFETSQIRKTNSIKSFTFSLYPIALWLVLFSNCKFIPAEYRPKIQVSLLPTLEYIFFSTLAGILWTSLLSFFISKYYFKIVYHAEYITLVPLLLWVLNFIAQVAITPALDALLFLPYGILHYLSPVIFTLLGVTYGKMDIVKKYLYTLGWMNVTGVVTQLVLPCAAPWYNLKFGIAEANYSIPGDPAGLVNVDKLFGTQLFSNVFQSSPLVFGALPSLHSAMAVLVMLFCFKISKKIGYLAVTYTIWMWMATIYFKHHYMVDVYVGMIYALVGFGLNKFVESDYVDILPLYVK